MPDDDLPAVTANPLLEAELSAVAWASLQAADDPAGFVPAAVRALVAAGDEKAAHWPYWHLDLGVVKNGGLYEATEPLIAVLFAALQGPLSPAARRAISELLTEASLASAPDDEALAERCLAALREGLWIVYGLFLDPDPILVSNALLIVARVDPDRRRCRRMLALLQSHDDEVVRREAAREAAALDGPPGP